MVVSQLAVTLPVLGGTHTHIQHCQQEGLWEQFWCMSLTNWEWFLVHQWFWTSYYSRNKSHVDNFKWNILEWWYPCAVKWTSWCCWARVMVYVINCPCCKHYNDVITGAMASQITRFMIVYQIVYPGADQRKHQSSVSLAFVRGIHRWPVNCPHKMTSNAQNVSIWWRHHESYYSWAVECIQPRCPYCTCWYGYLGLLDCFFDVWPTDNHSYNI